MIYRINLYEEVKGQKFFDLLKIIKEKTKVISLERFPNMDIKREELEKINGEYINLIHKEDIERRKQFEINSSFRKNMLDIFDGDKKRVEEYFDETLSQAISGIYQDLDFHNYEDDYNYDNDGEYYEEDYDDYEDYEDYDEEFEDDYIDDNIESFSEDDDFVIYPKELWSKGEYVNYYGDLIKKELTRITNTSIGPITEVSYFILDRIYYEILNQMKSIYTWPINIDNYLFENPSFLGEDRVILAVSSRDKFTFLNLNDEEYLKFLDLDIEHTVEKY